GRVCPHHRDLLPGRAALPRRLERARRRGAPGAGNPLLPPEGGGHLPPGDLGALELRQDPGRPDPRHLVEAAPAGHARPAHGDGGRRRVEGTRRWITCVGINETGGSARASGPTWATCWAPSRARWVSPSGTCFESPSPCSTPPSSVSSRIASGACSR